MENEIYMCAFCEHEIVKDEKIFERNGIYYHPDCLLALEQRQQRVEDKRQKEENDRTDRDASQIFDSVWRKNVKIH